MFVLTRSRHRWLRLDGKQDRVERALARAHRLPRESELVSAADGLEVRLDGVEKSIREA